MHLIVWANWALLRALPSKIQESNRLWAFYQKMGFNSEHPQDRGRWWFFLSWSYIWEFSFIFLYHLPQPHLPPPLFTSTNRPSPGCFPPPPLLHWFCRVTWWFITCYRRCGCWRLFAAACGCWRRVLRSRSPGLDGDRTLASWPWHGQWWCDSMICYSVDWVMGYD